MRKSFLSALCFSLWLISMVATAQNYTVLVSLDGCRWDYPQMYDAPYLNQLAEKGVLAMMQPSFPSKTFPNHYTLATGLYPDHHGIISNSFVDKETGLYFSLGNKSTKKDPRFWKGEPIWQTAARQGVRMGCVYWPGSDVPINLGQTPRPYPTYYRDYDQPPLLEFGERVAEVKRLLSLPYDERPRLVFAYFEEPDHMGHSYGPASAEARSAFEAMDSIVASLYIQLMCLPIRDSINFIVTSDHGMTTLSADRIIELDKYLPKRMYERIWYDIPTQVFVKKGGEQKVIDALKDVPHLRVWRKSDVPEYLHYGTNTNIGEVVVLPDLGWSILRPNRDGSPGKLKLVGTHGYDPAYSDMLVPFVAIGPDFRKGYRRSSAFANVGVYGLLCQLLGIEPAPNDGGADIPLDLLRDTPQ